jgi:predicted aminopeptidase
MDYRPVGVTGNSYATRVWKGKQLLNTMLNDDIPFWYHYFFWEVYEKGVFTDNDNSYWSGFFAGVFSFGR